MNNNTTKSIFLAVSLLSAPLAANAALIAGMGGQVVYDTDLDITWLADANLASSNTFGVSGINAFGQMDWYTAQTWLGAMNAANYLGYSNWRLPDTAQPDLSCSAQTTAGSEGVDCTGSEMPHLFYNELGGQAAASIDVIHNDAYDLFQNIQGPYWSTEAVWPGNGTYAWQFHFDNGNQNDTSKSLATHYVWAVHSGNIAGVSAVPLPAAAWLFGAGLAGLVAVAKRRAKYSENSLRDR